MKPLNEELKKEIYDRYVNGKLISKTDLASWYRISRPTLDAIIKQFGENTRESVMAKFTIEEILSNPVTLQTVRDRLEQIDKLNGC